MKAFFEAFRFFSSGGIIIIIIMLLSIIAFAIIIERFKFYKTIKKLTDDFFISIKSEINEKNYEKVVNIIDSNPDLPLSKILKLAIKQAPYVEKEELKEIIQDEGYRQSYHMKKRLIALQTIATISPLLGLLGTVTGMIRSFFIIASAGGNPEALAGGISEALSTTAAGLIVAIPVIMIYSILAHKNQLIVLDMEEKMGHLVNFIKGISIEE